jgi:hypothetical protein
MEILKKKGKCAIVLENCPPFKTLEDMWELKTPLHLKHVEGPEKATRGGVNESQSKLLTVTWLISRNHSDAPLF